MPPAAARRLLTAPPAASTALPRDFLLWLYRTRTHLTWAALGRQPAWRTEWDLTYMGLEALAHHYHAEIAAAAQEQQAFDAWRTRARAALRGGAPRA